LAASPAALKTGSGKQAGPALKLYIVILINVLKYYEILRVKLG